MFFLGLGFFHILLEYLHSVVSKIDDNDCTFWWDANSAGPIELTRTLTFTSKLCNKGAGWREDLDAVIARVCHHDVTFFIDGYTVRPCEHALVGTLEKYDDDETPRGIQMVSKLRTSFPRYCAHWKSGPTTSRRWLLKSVTTIWSSGVKQTPLGESKCFHSLPSKPYLARKSPCGENNWMRWLRVSLTKMWSRLLVATSHG